MIHHKKRTFVHGHDRRKHHSCHHVSVKGHIREFDTRGQVARKEKSRPKHAREVDEAIRAEGTRPISNKKNLGRWQEHPDETDISGVDS
jgi:hypothetical protein